MIHHGDCLDVMRGFDPGLIDSIITDPPYGLSFMGKGWDHGVPGVPYWAEMLRVAKPGAMLLAFGGTRTFHRLTCAIEDAGWEIRDCLMWLYGSGFPKSMDISKAIDKAAGAEREVVGKSNRHVSGKPEQRTEGLCGSSTFQETVGMGMYVTAPATDPAKLWDGWGTALKPAWEPIILAMKPLDGTFSANAQTHGVAGLNIDGCRIPTTDKLGGGHSTSGQQMGEGWSRPWMSDPQAVAANAARSQASVAKSEELGRWPANVILDEEAGAALDTQTGVLKSGSNCIRRKEGYFGAGDSKHGGLGQAGDVQKTYGDSGGASRFFYCAKAGKKEKGEDNTHPTVKPLAVMEYLCTLTKTPTGGIVLDPFAGSGTTLLAARNTGRPFIGIEKEADYITIINKRLANENTNLSVL